MSIQGPQEFLLRMRSQKSFFASHSVAKRRRELRHVGVAGDAIKVSRITVVDPTDNEPLDVIEMRAMVTFAQMAAADQMAVTNHFDEPIVIRMLREAELDEAEMLAAIDEAALAGYDRAVLEDALVRPGRSFELEATWRRGGDPDEVEAWRQQMSDQLAAVGVPNAKIAMQCRAFKRLVRSQLTTTLSIAQAHTMQISEREVAAQIYASGVTDQSVFDGWVNIDDVSAHESLLIEAERVGFNRELLEAELEWDRADRFSPTETDAADSVRPAGLYDDLEAAAANHPNFMALAQRAGIELWTEDLEEWDAEAISFEDGDEWPEDVLGLAVSIDFTLAQAKAVGYSVEEVAALISDQAEDKTAATTQAIEAGFDAERLHQALAELDDATARHDPLLDLVNETKDTAEVAYSIGSALDDRQRSLYNSRYDLADLVEAAAAAGHTREHLQAALDQWYGSDPLPLTATEQAREAEWDADTDGRSVSDEDEDEEYV